MLQIWKSKILARTPSDVMAGCCGRGSYSIPPLGTPPGVVFLGWNLGQGAGQLWCDRGILL